MGNAIQELPNADFHVGLESGIEGKSQSSSLMIIEANGQRGESRLQAWCCHPLYLISSSMQMSWGMHGWNLRYRQHQAKRWSDWPTDTQPTSRSSVYHRLILALIPFVNPEHFPRLALQKESPYKGLSFLVESRTSTSRTKTLTDC